jgi:hypothetical protein
VRLRSINRRPLGDQEFGVVLANIRDANRTNLPKPKYMTTRAELKRYAKSFFTPELIKRGFALTPRGYSYMRRAGDVWHFIIPGFSSGNGSMNWVVTAWVPELALQPYDLNSLPDELNIYVGGRLGKAGPSSSGYELWPAATQEECASSFLIVLQRLDEVGLPWLDQITTREALADKVNPPNAVDRYGNKTIDKIFGRNLLYRDKVKPIGS